MNRVLHSRRVDPAIAVVLFAVGVTEVAGSPFKEGPLALNALTLAVMALAFAIRRRRPLTAAGLFVPAALLQAVFLTAPDQIFMPFMGLLLIPYAAGAYAARGPAVAATAGCVVVVIAVSVFGDGLTVGDVLFPGMFCVASLAAGRAVRGRTQLAAELHELAVQAEEAREHEAERAQAEERRRIAREMHDVVAHSISVMVVQAGGARRIMDRDPGRAVHAAAEIERTGREALVEMRRLLGVLRPGDEPAARAPQPGLDGLDALVARARDAGLPVSLDVEGDRRPVPTGLDLAAYRIVQEALTNAIKHAGSAPTDVTLRWSEEALEIEVADQGTGPGQPRLDGAGHGLIGMRERVRLYGGDIQTGQRRGGGFEVRARLPLQTEEVTA